MAERGIHADHSTINRWVIKYAPSLEHQGHNGLPEKVVIDKSGANALALHNINVQLWLTGRMFNLVEQSHRRVKGKMNQCLGWKSDEGARATFAGVELWSMIKNGQLDTPEDLSVWDEFDALAA